MSDRGGHRVLDEALYNLEDESDYRGEPWTQPPTRPPVSIKAHRRGWLVRRVLVAADLIGLLLAFWVAQAVFVGSRSGKFDLLMEAILFAATLPLWVLVARVYGLYSQDDRRTNHATTDETASVFNMVTVCTWLFFASPG